MFFGFMKVSSGTSLSAMQRSMWVRDAVLGTDIGPYYRLAVFGEERARLIAG